MTTWWKVWEALMYPFWFWNSESDKLRADGFSGSDLSRSATVNASKLFLYNSMHAFHKFCTILYNFVRIDSYIWWYTVVKLSFTFRSFKLFNNFSTLLFIAIQRKVFSLDVSTRIGSSTELMYHTFINMVISKF